MSSVQINLLPDVKLEYIKAQRLKRMVMAVAIVAAAGSLFLLVMMTLAVLVFQKQHLNNLNDDIKRDSSTLESKTDLAKILTVQNQLLSLPALHDGKPVTSRLFGYLKQLVPDKITIAQLAVDFDAHTLTITGAADKLSTVNKFVDTLKFTTFTTSSNSEETAAFTGVVLSSFSRNEASTNYSITLTYSPDIFTANNEAKLKVPVIITTRSETEKPSALFQEQTNEESGQ